MIVVHVVWMLPWEPREVWVSHHLREVPTGVAQHPGSWSYISAPEAGAASLI